MIQQTTQPDPYMEGEAEGIVAASADQDSGLDPDNLILRDLCRKRKAQKEREWSGKKRVLRIESAKLKAKLFEMEAKIDEGDAQLRKCLEKMDEAQKDLEA